MTGAPVAFLLDTNCWMEVIRGRPNAADVQALLADVPDIRLALSDFSLHSVGVVMRRKGIVGQFSTFIADVDIGVAVDVVTLGTDDMRRVADACVAHGLDFDDAYQYVAAELHGLKLVSLDAGFDRTPNGRLTPAAALQVFRDEQSRQQNQQP